MHGLGITEIPEKAYDLTEITSLLVRHNALECSETNLTVSISPRLAAFTALTILDLGWNKLKVLPPCVFELPVLESLIVNNNEIEELSPLIANFAKTLKTLHLGVNLLKTLPREIGQLSALNSLIAPNNQISHLPETMSDLTALDDIYLRHNALTSFPMVLLRLQRLSIISMEDNNIVALPEPSEFSRPSIAIHHSVPQEIIPHLWIGSSSSSKNRPALTKYELTHHLALTDAIGDSHSVECSSISDHCFKDRLLLQINDVEAQNIDEAISQCNAFIERAVKDGGRVLINSTLGVSRSAAIICAYMIKNLNMSYDEAIARIRSLRSNAKPNAGFERQLRAYEQLVRK